MGGFGVVSGCIGVRMFLVMRLSGLSVMLVPSRFWGCSMFSTSRILCWCYVIGLVWGVSRGGCYGLVVYGTTVVWFRCGLVLLSWLD